MRLRLMLRRTVAVLLISLLVIGWNQVGGNSIHAASVQYPDRVGVTHLGGKYGFSSRQDILNEGADQLLALGTRVIKLSFGSQYREMYPINSIWPDVTNMTELALSKSN